MPTIKNILIFVGVAAVFVFIYLYFIRGSNPNQAPLVSSSSAPVSGVQNTNPNLNQDNSLVAKEFLTLLLNVKNIKLNDAIFSDNAFISLRDSSIILVPDGNEGRINPFAPIGIESNVESSIIPSTP